MSKPPSAWAIERALSVWHDATQRLLWESDLEIDEDWLSTTLGEAQADVHSMIDRLLQAYQHCTTTSHAITDQVVSLEKRHDRYQARAKALRETMTSIMGVIEESRVELPSGTLSLKPGRTSVNVTNVDALPEEAIRITRAADKKWLHERLAEGEVIDGAELVTGPPVLTVRTN